MSPPDGRGMVVVSEEGSSVVAMILILLTHAGIPTRLVIDCHAIPAHSGIQKITSMHITHGYSAS
jgi:hypothetical protein